MAKAERAGYLRRCARLYGRPRHERPTGVDGRAAPGGGRRGGGPGTPAGRRRLVIGDGEVEFTVAEKNKDTLRCMVTVAGLLGSRKCLILEL